MLEQVLLDEPVAPHATSELRFKSVPIQGLFRLLHYITCRLSISVYNFVHCWSRDHQLTVFYSSSTCGHRSNYSNIHLDSKEELLQSCSCKSCRQWMNRSFQHLTLSNGGTRWWKGDIQLVISTHFHEFRNQLKWLVYRLDLPCAKCTQLHDDPEEFSKGRKVFPTS